jgi:hypothetical protein
MAETNVEFKNIKEKVLAPLNNQQKQAALEYYGPCAVNAGPGSGNCVM